MVDTLLLISPAYLWLHYSHFKLVAVNEGQARQSYTVRPCLINKQTKTGEVTMRERSSKSNELIVNLKFT